MANSLSAALAQNFEIVPDSPLSHIPHAANKSLRCCLQTVPRTQPRLATTPPPSPSVSDDGQHWVIASLLEEARPCNLFLIQAGIPSYYFKSLPITLKYFLYVGAMHTCGSQGHRTPLELEVLSCLIWVLETKFGLWKSHCSRPGSFVKTELDLTHYFARSFPLTNKA